jgi:hypothetical protein
VHRKVNPVRTKEKTKRVNQSHPQLIADRTAD